MIGSGDARVSEDRRPDPQQDAERRLRQALASEARTQRDQLGTIQKGFYGCVGLLVLVFLALLFLS
jgi:hypothetical protein